MRSDGDEAAAGIAGEEPRAELGGVGPGSGLPAVLMGSLMRQFSDCSSLSSLFSLFSRRRLPEGSGPIKVGLARGRPAECAIAPHPAPQGLRAHPQGPARRSAPKLVFPSTPCWTTMPALSDTQNARAGTDIPEIVTMISARSLPPLLLAL